MLWLLPVEDETHEPRTPWCTWLLIALNVALFFPLGMDLDGYGLDSADPKWYQFISSSFSHAGVAHLLGNMYFLWLFGDDVEDVFGHVPFLLLYFLGGFAGDLLFVYANDLHIPSVGASGCISALAGAYAVLFCHRNLKLKVIALVFPVYSVAINAVTLALLYFGVDFALTVYHLGKLPDEPGINFVAHGVGVAFGVAIALGARAYGVMDRFERAVGSALWGYWPRDVGADEARRSRAAYSRKLAHLARPNAWGEKGGRK
jgi:membrane associated rhomboid family serine protease